MNREQMIEKAARAICKSQVPAWSAAWKNFRSDWMRDGAAVVDAILPQVSTVEEWETLPYGSLLVDKDGLPYWRGETPSSDILISWLTEPLTVVWQP